MMNSMHRNAVLKALKLTRYFFAVVLILDLKSLSSTLLRAIAT